MFRRFTAHCIKGDGLRQVILDRVNFWMSDACESSKGYRYPKLVIGHAIYLYHRLPISNRDVQELLLKRGIEVSHETVRAWCVRFGPDLAEELWHRKPKRGRVWQLDEMRNAD